jgi:hypothetical protein
MLPVIGSVTVAHRPPAGMISEASRREIEVAVLSFILGMWTPRVPNAVAQCRREHSGSGNIHR